MHTEANAFGVENKCASAHEGERTCSYDKTYMYSTCTHLKEAKGNVRALVHTWRQFRAHIHKPCFHRKTLKAVDPPLHTAQTQTCSLAVTSTRSHAEGNVFTHRDKRVHSWRQPCSHAETNAFTCGDKSVCTWRQMHSHAKANAIVHEGKRICVQMRTSSQAEANLFARRGKCVCVILCIRSVL